MIHTISERSIDQIRNPAFRQYAGRYLEIERDFRTQIGGFGLEFEEIPDLLEQGERLGRLQAHGVQIRNDRKSLVHAHISPSCLACRTAENSETFFISLRCHRDCYFCFNPNQENYEHFLDHQRDPAQELRQFASQGRKLEHIALTGGEPLLHIEKSLDFFRTAQQVYPEAYTRLYTSGDQLHREHLAAFAAAGLDEIRISIRLHDTPLAHQHTYDRLALAREYIPHVLVEMPVLPNSYAEMVTILDRLEQIGIEGINLLEFCFPLNNVAAFRERNYKIKTPSFRVLYNYWYAGGLPIAGSEQVCLDLLQYALDQKLKLGIHYCSLENKHSGQIFTQNSKTQLSRTEYFSHHDFFIKTAKVFGEDIAPVKQALIKIRRAVFEQHSAENYLEFHPRLITQLAPLDVQVAISYCVVETRAEVRILRELKVDWTTPQSFDITQDI